MKDQKEVDIDIRQVFEQLKNNQFKVANYDLRQRKSRLDQLQQTILNFREKIKDALYRDFQKHAFEVDLTEIYPVISEIKQAKRNLRRWMGHHPVSTPISLLGSRSRIHYEPKGIVLIISPWNFPVTLTLGPLVSAIAAGNTVILKPSEQTPAATAVMQEIIELVFPPEEVVLIPGGVETSRKLLSLPFNHIFFTGSSKVGKIIMESAAKNLASVTLELGGKSPTIIDASANIRQAARRIIWAKFINCGQICIAPDHIYVQETVSREFIATLKQYLNQYFGNDAREEPSYARLVNHSHYERLVEYLENALKNGASIEYGGNMSQPEKYIEPTILTGTSPESLLMNEEIFGPLLPVIPFSDMDELVHILNKKEKPLASYIYSKSNKNIKKLIESTRSGAICINHSGIHFYNSNLPFGGSNFSGIGKAHGWFGFQAFSNARAVYNQIIPGPLEILIPPYNKIKQRVLDFAIKYL
ncbi:MAG: aldehyde dehydrogenase family protein [Saprospiraceae bacterium]|nr:aldehyde dehydrogenase family protein [Saprospiraceae bacterium]